MSAIITTAFVQSFKDGVMHVAQQSGSKLRSLIRVESQNSELQAYDQLGPTYMIEKLQEDVTAPAVGQGRHGASPILDTVHLKRNVEMGNWILGDAIDDQDQVLALNDFKSPYVRAFGFAAGRQMDYVMVNGGLQSSGAGGTGIGGIFGTNRVGKSGGTSFSWEDWVGVGVGGGLGPDLARYEVDQTHADHQIEHGAVGMTLDKWIDAKTVLDGEDLTEDDGGRCLVITEIQARELLSDPQLTSSDYNTVKALVNGEVGTFLGMQVLVISSKAKARADVSISGPDGIGAPDIGPIMPQVSGVPDFTRCFAFSKRYLLMTLGIDMEANIVRRGDLNFTWYAHLAATFGATRMEEKAFVEIQCATS